jgi:hypothetical protein
VGCVKASLLSDRKGAILAEYCPLCDLATERAFTLAQISIFEFSSVYTIKRIRNLKVIKKKALGQVLLNMEILS